MSTEYDAVINIADDIALAAPNSTGKKPAEVEKKKKKKRANRFYCLV